MRRALATCALMLALLVPSEAWSASWTTPETVSEAGRYRFIGGVALAASPGRAAIAWQRGDPGNQVRAARAGRGGFGRSVALRTQRSALGDAAVAIDDRGNTFVAYRRHVLRNHRVEYVAIRPGGGRTIPDLLSGAGTSAYDPTFALAPKRPPRLAWWRREPGRVQVAAFNGAMQAPVDTLELSGGPTAGYAQGSGGELLAATVDAGRVVVARQRAGEPFGPAAPVSAPARVNQPQLAVGPGDSAVVVWRQFDGSTYRLMAATRPDGTAPFGAPRVLTGGDIRADAPQVAITSGGTPMAIYLARAPGAGSADTGVLHLVDLSSGVDRLLSPSRSRVGAAQLASDGADRVSVIWMGAPIWQKAPVYGITTSGSSTRGTVRRLTARGERAAFAPALAANAPGVGFRAAWTSAGGKVRAVRR